MCPSDSIQLLDWAGWEDNPMAKSLLKIEQELIKADVHVTWFGKFPFKHHLFWEHLQFASRLPKPPASILIPCVDNMILPFWLKSLGYDVTATMQVAPIAIFFKEVGKKLGWRIPFELYPPFNYIPYGTNSFDVVGFLSIRNKFEDKYTIGRSSLRTRFLLQCARVCRKHLVFSVLWNRCVIPFLYESILYSKSYHKMRDLLKEIGLEEVSLGTHKPIKEPFREDGLFTFASMAFEKNRAEISSKIWDKYFMPGGESRRWGKSYATYTPYGAAKVVSRTAAAITVQYQNGDKDTFKREGLNACFSGVPW